MKVFVINGYPKSGKDQFVQYCKESCGNNYIIINLVTSTPAKEALKCLGWDGKEKTPEIRLYLYEFMRVAEEFDGIFDWVKRSVDWYVSWFENNPRLRDSKEVIAFIHSREPYNIIRYQAEFDAKTILLINPKVESAGNNPSDKDVENFDYDYYIYNDGDLEDLRETAREFMEGEVL